MKSVTRGASRAQKTAHVRAWWRGELDQPMFGGVRASRKRKRPCGCDMCRAGRQKRKEPIE
jgi:hypothetical protein